MVISLKICVLGSGSSGNATLIASSKAKILIDCGFNCKEVFARLKEIDINPLELDAVVLTHEHSDHIKGLPVLLKRLDIPVYSSQGTWRAIKKNTSLDHGQVHTFHNTQDFEIKDIGFRSFPVLHDAADPVGFCFLYNQAKAGIVTDLGRPTHLVRESLKGAQCLIIESNHDPGMLFRGPYPWWLKQRIKGSFGHLSNEDSALLLSELLNAELRSVILAHVSKTNNQEEIVHLNALRVLHKMDFQPVDLQIAVQDRVIRPVEVI